MYEKEHKALNALACLMSENLTTLGVGDLDSVGSANYGKPETVPGGRVDSLQEVLTYIVDDYHEEPDGAFGRKTSEALERVTGQKSFDRSRDLHLLVDHLANKMVQQVSAPVDAPLAAQPIENSFEPMLVEPPPVHFSQVDPRWAEVKMGVDMPFRRGGCGICCMAMLFGWIRNKWGGSDPVNPKMLDAWMDSNKGYAAGSNMIIWKNMEKFMVRKDAGKFMVHTPVVYQQDGNSAAPLTHEEGMARAQQYLSHRKQPIILRVKYRQTTSKSWFNHFVLACGIREDGEILFLDPRNMIADIEHEQSNTAQTINKGGYDVVGIEQYTIKENLV